MAEKLKIAVFTSTRAEYGLFRPLLKLLQEDEATELQLLVAGAHLSERFGYTKTSIVEDKFHITAEFDFLEEPDGEDHLTRSLARLQHGLGKWLFENKPDWLVVLGDRFELLAVASAALLTQTPLAHISGGDVTEGALDNQVRHAVTKMAHAHFPATEAAKNMLLALNEDPARICLSGEPGLDQLKTMDYVPKDELFMQLGLDVNKPTAIVTFHPDTLTKSINADFVKKVMADLTAQNFQVMATGSNFDEGGDAINKALQEVVLDNKDVKFMMSLGQRRYYSMLRHVVLMVGNSSSGIAEAQSFELPVINVGSRQQGRHSNPNVINVAADVEAIRNAIPQALSAKFREGFAGKPNSYGDGNACGKIVKFLKEFPRKNILAKY